MHRLLIACVTLALAAAVVPGAARADGDPGSDVLVDQNYFVAGDAGLSVAEQAQLGDVLQSASNADLPVRVAIIATPSDLGSITGLWRRPQEYAGFLGFELSLAYRGRLLIVMPNGFGFNWPGHPETATERLLARIPIGTGGDGLFAAALAAVRGIATAAGVRLAPAVDLAATGAAAGAATGATGATGAVAAGTGASPAPAVGPSVVVTSAPSNPGQGADQTVTVVVLGLALLLAIAFAARHVARRRRAPAPVDPPVEPGTASPAVGERTRARPATSRLIPGFALLVGIAALAPIVIFNAFGTPAGVSGTAALASNPYLDPGTALPATPAPDFTLNDQFGQTVSLRAFRGKVVLLAFTDSECTTICPMTTTAMLNARAMLGAAASKVVLLGIDANPASTSLEDVYAYSQLHGMLHQWHFLTGSLQQLKRVWSAYKVYANIEHGLISHTAALFVISPQGREAKVYVTQQSYSAVTQFAQILAHEAASLLPGHPRVHSDLSYAPVAEIAPSESVNLARAGGGTVHLGPGHGAHLFVFFATWDREVTSLAGQLDALNAYRSSAGGTHLPPLTAVDEGRVEPSSEALPAFLKTLPRRLDYPVAIDATGRVADGYEVQGEPWYVLTSGDGRILWYWEESTSGWLSRAQLAAHVRAALARAPRAPTTSAAVAHDLAGSPAPLAAVHRQAGRLLGGGSALAARIRALRGYPIVVNAWASWCEPCQEEFHLFADASAIYGRHVAFLGVDTDDAGGDAQAFLAAHPVSYPSYQEPSTDALSWLAVIEGLPSTVFIDASGHVVYAHDGQYFSQGSLDADITSYAAAG
jgi:cytochrome oxidase Cu insertion factor (SCO1/SenC/PrrC family)/thiol-disulfide isomerase/thioredoxin